jgi:hypothetical protein
LRISLHNDSLLHCCHFGQSDLNIRGSGLFLRGEVGGCGNVSLQAGYEMKGRKSCTPQRSVALRVGSGFTARIRTALNGHAGQGLPVFVHYRHEDAIA